MSVYIRKDKKGDKVYYRLVESHREGKKVVQRHILSLGTKEPTPEHKQALIKQYSKRETD